MNKSTAPGAAYTCRNDSSSKQPSTAKLSPVRCCVQALVTPWQADPWLCAAADKLTALCGVQNISPEARAGLAAGALGSCQAFTVLSVVAAHSRPLAASRASRCTGASPLTRHSALRCASCVLHTKAFHEICSGDASDSFQKLTGSCLGAPCSPGTLRCAGLAASPHTSSRHPVCSCVA